MNKMLNSTIDGYIIRHFVSILISWIRAMNRKLLFNKESAFYANDHAATAKSTAKSTC